VTDVIDAPHQDRPLYWLIILDQAVEKGDHQAAAEAQRQLARLGVRVAYGRPRGKHQEDRHAAE
jgi:hypothetical protein